MSLTLYRILGECCEDDNVPSHNAMWLTDCNMIFRLIYWWIMRRNRLNIVSGAF